MQGRSRLILAPRCLTSAFEDTSSSLHNSYGKKPVLWSTHLFWNALIDIRTEKHFQKRADCQSQPRQLRMARGLLSGPVCPFWHSQGFAVGDGVGRNEFFCPSWAGLWAVGSGTVLGSISSPGKEPPSKSGGAQAVLPGGGTARTARPASLRQRRRWAPLGRVETNALICQLLP